MSISQLKLPKSLEEDIELISKLEYVEIRKIEDSFLQDYSHDDYDDSHDIHFQDESDGIHFESSSEVLEPPTATYKFHVLIRLKECVYAISKKKDCVVSLHIELRDDLKYPLIDIKSITNSSIKLRNKCEYFFSNVAFGGSSTTPSFSPYAHSIYKLIVEFMSFLRYESRNGDIQNIISESSSNFEEFITLSISSINEQEFSPKDFPNNHNDWSNHKTYDRAFKEPMRYNSITVNTNDKIYTHLTTHSRYFREFKEESVLGSGSFGCVTKVTRNSINYAVKQIPIYEKFEYILHEEAAVLASLHHPNIVRYYDAWVEESPEYLLSKFRHQPSLNDTYSNNHNSDYTPGNRGLQFKSNLKEVKEDVDLDEEDKDEMNENPDESIENEQVEVKGNRNLIKIHNRHYKKNKFLPKKCLFILMEYCGEASLFDTINNHTLHETPEKVIDLFRQLMEALSYIHEKGIIHRDVKPSNIFLKFENEFLIKLGDFGLTAKMHQTKGNKTIPNETGVVGTLHYMAPEHLESDPCNEKVDIYSAGVVLFEMLSRPFQTFMERCEILSSFSTPNKQWPEGFRERIDNRLFKLLESMLNINPNKRPSASEILQNEIFTSNKLNLQSLYTVITQYPHSMESVQLLTTIFSRKQQYKKLSDYYNMVTSNNVINYVNLELGLIYDKEFKLRNAHKIHLHLLTHLPYHSTQKSNGMDKDLNAVKDGNKFRGRLLLNNGRCCYLRYSLLYSFSECIPKELTTIIRRYSYSPVYSSNTIVGTGTRMEGRNINYFLGYDIIVDYSVIFNEGDEDEDENNLDAFFTYELVSVSCRPIKRFINCTLVLEWNHSEFLSMLLRFVRVPEQHMNRVEKLMLSETQIKGKVNGLSDELSNLLITLQSFLHRFKGKFSDFRKELESLLSCEITQEFAEYLENLQFFEKFLTDCDVIFYFNPTYSEISSSSNSSNIATIDGWDNDGIRGGIFEKYYFRIFLEIGKRNFGDIIFGGCYNRIIENNINRRNAFGFEMNLQPIYDYFTQNMVNKNLYNNLYLNYAPEVVVYTPQMNLIMVATGLENKFWSMGVKCYKKVRGQLNIKRIARLKKIGLFSLQKLKYLVTIKKSNENHEIQYIIADINLDNKYTFGGEDNVLELILHDINPN